MRFTGFTVMAFTAAALTAAGALAGQTHQHGQGHGHSPYAGEESREIKSLSDDDIRELRRGGGWGLAKAAELNGYPGPAHVLELGAELGLSAEQRTAIQMLFDRMQTASKEEGERLIGFEKTLEARFRERNVDASSLRAALADVEKSRQSLRYIHLAAHLDTPAILTPEQVRAYARLRGYAADPCAEVPAGHDPAMWRKHQGCN